MGETKSTSWLTTIVTAFVFSHGYPGWVGDFVICNL
jgi:hypothetical protein